MNKPAAKVLTPSEGMAARDEEAIRDVQEHVRRQEELDARNQVKMNKVATLLGSGSMVLDKTWPFLVWKGQQLSVSEFFIDKNIAVDKFYNVDEFEPAAVEFKKKVLKENGIKYAYLTPEKSLADLEPDLEG